MKSSDLLKIAAIANRRAGHEEYANFLDNTSAVYEAVEVLKEEDDS